MLPIKNISVNDISIIDETNEITDGNNDGNLNPGELVYLSLPLINYGNVTANSLQGILTSDSNLVNIIYGILQYDAIISGEIGYQTGNYIIEISEDALDAEDLEFRLSISDFFGNTWEE